MRKVYVGPFCSRLIGFTRRLDDDCGMRWLTATIAKQTVYDDMHDRNRALQEARRAAQPKADGRSKKALRRQGR